MKRQSILNEISGVDIKKLRKTTDEEEISSIEDLSTEIFYEIFDYLDGYDICRAFSNLNHRFEKMINSSSLLLKFFVEDNGSEFQLDMKDYCRDIIIPNRQRIISLHIIDSILINEFFTFCIVDTTFERLESITLNDFPITDILILLFYLKNLPRLFALTVHAQYKNFYDNKLSPIYRLILQLPDLKYNFPTAGLRSHVNPMIPIAFNQQWSKIEYFSMNHTCSLPTLISILAHMPRLHHLTCEEIREFCSQFEDITYSTLPHLTSLRIKKCFAEFYKFEEFISKICSSLKTCFIWHYFNQYYIEPNQWKQLILKHMLQLQKFDLNCFVEIENDIDFDININIDSFANQFNSSFWTERGWVSEMEIQPEGFIYSIYSKKEKWFTFEKNMEITTYSPVNLTIKYFDDISIELSFEDKFISLLRAIQITSLSISRTSNIFPDNLIDIIDLLPNLDTLKISYLLIRDSIELSTEKADKLQQISVNNKISRVWQRMQFTLLNFLINLCPHMEQLELDNVKEKNLTKILQTILMKRSTHIPDLYSVCFNINNANDEILDHVKQIIDAEKLLLNYNIKRKGYGIFLQWKIQ